MCFLASGLGAFGANALIVHDGTAGLEANVLANLTTHLTNKGFTVSSNVGVPVSLAANQQVWDIRFNNTTPLSGTDITAYVAYLASGKSLFVMGENTGFATRNNTIVTLISTAGGGNITVSTPGQTQTVQAPFTGPTPLSTITYLAGAGTANPVNGTFVTKDGANSGTALVWGPGNLLNAVAGTLIVVFDVNFLDLSADANSQILTDNMIGFLAVPVPVGVPPATGTPTLSEWGLAMLVAAVLGAGLWNLRKTDTNGAAAA